MFLFQKIGLSDIERIFLSRLQMLTFSKYKIVIWQAVCKMCFKQVIHLYIRLRTFLYL